MPDDPNPIGPPDEFAAFRGLPAGWYRDATNPEMAHYWDGTNLSTETRVVTGPSQPIAGPQLNQPSPSAPNDQGDPM